MRSIFTFTIAVLILTACSQTPITATSTPLPSIMPTHISTVTPTVLPTSTSPAFSPEQMDAYEKIADYYKDIWVIDTDGSVADLQGNSIEGVAYDMERMTLTRTYYSELLGREITEPMSGIVKYEKGADGKAKATGEIDFPNCTYEAGVCNLEYAVDPVTGKEVKSALKHSLYDVMLLQLQDMQNMSDQDKKDAYNFTGDYSMGLIEPNYRRSDKKVYLVYNDETGKHEWQVSNNGTHITSNEIFVRGRGILRGTNKFIFEAIEDGKTGFVVWVVGVGTESETRREIFIGEQNITSYILNTPSYPFTIDPEWLPEEYQDFPLLPFD